MMMFSLQKCSLSMEPRKFFSTELPFEGATLRDFAGRRDPDPLGARPSSMLKD
jgi:hypothetical protein